MEHIMNIAINFDDDRIREIVETKAAETIIKDIKQDICNRLFNGGYGYGRRNTTSEDPLSEFSIDIIRSVINENKEQIIQKAVAEVSKSLMKTKAVKEAMTDILAGASQ